jgi:hypothetical protein
LASGLVLLGKGVKVLDKGLVLLGYSLDKESESFIKD